MAAKRKGRAISGWLVIDKPAGLSSAAAVAQVRRILDAQKAGHAGTLDPAATGVLAVALGEATKTVAFITQAQKSYRFTMRLGQATNTDDAEGEVIATSALRPSDEEIVSALAPFTGDIMQVPPKFSAVKINGQRAHALARDGQDVSPAARALFVHDLRLTARPDPDHAELEMTCGKGGYVRSIARDLGEALGCLGHVTAIRRISSGPFDIERAISIDALSELPTGTDVDALLLPLQVALGDVAQATCSETSAGRLRHGNPSQVIAPECSYGDTVWASFRGQPVAIGTYRAGELHPTRVFNL